MNDLVKRLRIKASVMEMGERIEWDSNIALIALMREAADMIGELEHRLAELIDFREKAFEAHPSIDIDIELLNTSTQGKLSYYNQN